MMPPIVAVSGFGQDESAQSAWLRRAIWGAMFGAAAGIGVSELFMSKKGESETAKATRRTQYAKYGAVAGSAFGLLSTL